MSIEGLRASWKENFEHTFKCTTACLVSNEFSSSDFEKFGAYTDAPFLTVTPIYRNLSLMPLSNQKFYIHVVMSKTPDSDHFHRFSHIEKVAHWC